MNEKIASVEIGEQERQSLKKLAQRLIDNISENRAMVLLKDIRVLERFLFGIETKKEVHNSLTQHPSVYYEAYVKQNNKTNYRRRSPQAGGKTGKEVHPFRDGLRDVVGGMIRMMPPVKIKEIEANPIEFINLFIGMSFTAYGKEAEEKNFSVDKIAKDQWMNFPWGLSSIILVVQDIFKKAGRDVKVEFFRPNNQDYIVVTEIIDDKEKGILIPHYGIKLDPSMDFDLFQSKLKGKEVSSNILSFPEVERRSGKWKVTKHGKLKI